MVWNWQEISSLVSVLAVVFFAGAWWQQSNHNKETIKTIKESFDKSVATIEKNFQEKVFAMRDIFNTSISGLKETIDNNQKNTSEQLKQLEIKQDKHNNVIEKQYHLESRMDVQDTELKVANCRIRDLEQGYEHIRERFKNN